MQCLNCGREVEFNGNVCPWCGAQKLQSQSIHMFINIYGIPLGLPGGFIGDRMNGEYGMVVGGLLGAIIGVILGYRTGYMSFPREHWLKMLVVRIAHLEIVL